MLRLWPDTKIPQVFNALGTPYALRKGLLRIENQVIEVRCESGENCGVNFWIPNRAGTIHLHYSLTGTGGVYAIAIGDKREITDIPRLGVQLEAGRNARAHLPFRFDDNKVSEVVIGIRLNEGLPDAQSTGELILNQVDLDQELPLNISPREHPAWLILVPVTSASTDALQITYKFAVTDSGPSREVAEFVRGTSVENAIENSIEHIIFNRVNHHQMFEIRISRTAFEWANEQYVSEFLHAGRKYKISELVP